MNKMLIRQPVREFSFGFVTYPNGMQNEGKIIMIKVMASTKGQAKKLAKAEYRKMKDKR